MKKAAGRDDGFDSLRIRADEHVELSRKRLRRSEQAVSDGAADTVATRDALARSRDRIAHADETLAAGASRADGLGTAARDDERDDEPRGASGGRHQPQIDAGLVEPDPE